MITWMQKNKKYLVVTIWVSTIAFVGAGFVGWGAYDMNQNRANSVAKVGHRNISFQELNDKYSQLYNYYNSILNGHMTNEKANELGLQTAALDASIRENLLLNFAEDIGLRVSDNDVIKYIVADENFHKDGAFNENTYKDVLRRARINPKEYEKNLERLILLDKLNYAINLSASKSDIEMMLSSFFMQDTVSMKIIEATNESIKVDENELKTLWESTKNNYMTKTSYDFDTIFVPTKDVNASDDTLMAYYNDNKERYKDAEDKIVAFENIKNQVQKDYNLEQSKTTALERYVAIKKGEINTNETLKFDDEDSPFPMENLKDIKVNDVLKPMIYNDGYIVAKVKEIKLPEPMSFEMAREQVLKFYTAQKQKELLDEKVKAELKKFDAKDGNVVTISKATEGDVGGLDMFESRNFIEQVFASTNKKGYVLLDNKAVIYEILEQKLLTNDKDNEALVKENVASLKNNELMQELTKVLQKRYKVEEYIKR